MTLFHLLEADRIPFFINEIKFLSEQMVYTKRRVYFFISKDLCILYKKIFYFLFLFSLEL